MATGRGRVKDRRSRAEKWMTNVEVCFEIKVLLPDVLGTEAGGAPRVDPTVMFGADRFQRV